MPYDERLVAPMREELTRVGFEEWRSADQLKEGIGKQKGTTLVVVNSVCGCAAGMARPGVVHAVNEGINPDHLATVFAGQDLEAVATLRAMLSDIPPSSPSMALFKDGEIVWFLPRHQIEGRSAADVSNSLKTAFDRFCQKEKIA